MEQKLPNLEHRLATAERRVLIQLVKIAQKQKLEGENGEWKDFLAVNDKKHGANLSDPERRNNDVLIKFLTTFKSKEHLQLIAKVLQLDANRNLIEQFKTESPDKETPEQRLVRMTITHPEYPLSYSFPSHGDDWFVSGTGKKKKQVLKNTSMIAIDCEMVECEDGKDAMVRVAAVDRDLKSLLNEYVKPDLPVVDYRTQITGVTAEDVENAKFTVSDIQKKLTRFLSKGAIVVGHSLHNDLKVLKIDHARVIDTSLVFNYSSSTSSKKRPSLNGLCKSVLGYELRKDEADAHDCAQDAIAAMKLVLAVVEKGVDTSVAETKEELEAEKMKLFLHKIPHDVPSEELQAAITGDFTLNVKPAKKEGGFYSAVVNFSSSEDANRAFDKVNGDVALDRVGLPQKLVEFKLSSGTAVSLYVRKMVPDVTTERAHPVKEENNDNMRSKKEDDEEEEAENRRQEEKKKLLLHKIPSNVSSQELHLAITGDFTLDVMPAKKVGGFYSAVAIFNSSGEANRAFVNIEGDVEKDRSGLPQKLAEFKLSSGTESSLYVRKMFQGSEISSVVTTERARLEEDDDSEKENEELKSKLLIHKIPHIFPSQELQSAITGDFILDVQPPRKKGGCYSVIAVFNSSKEANRAFDSIGGNLVKDRSGLPQKLAVFKTSSGTEASLFVRKMVRDGVVTTKRAHPEEEEEEEEENNVSSKRQKREEENVNRCESLLKEIEELKEKTLLKEIEELKEKLKVKETVKSCDHRAEEKLKDDDSEIEELKLKLLIHKIPHNVPYQELKSAITGDFKVVVQPPKKRGGCYSVIAIFKSSEEANRAFDNVDGDMALDRAGLPQKLAMFKTSSGTEASLFVRKMVRDGVVTTTKRAHPEEEEEEKNASSKRQKREEDYKNRCEDLLKEVEELKEKLKVLETVKSCDHHAKEIQELEQKLKAKNLEIKTQDKMITNLRDKLEAKKTKSKSSR